MPIITKTRLQTIVQNQLGYTKTFSQVINESRTQSKYLATSTIFLSHSRDDKESVEKVVAFLSTLGIAVYVDWQDQSLPSAPNSETAEKIKKSIKDCKKFILLATNSAILSKWCNWELGYGDAHKFIEHIALFPLADTAETWNGNEYLKIYPRVEESNLTNDYYKIIYPDGREVHLNDWIKR